MLFFFFFSLLFNLSVAADWWFLSLFLSLFFLLTFSVVPFSSWLMWEEMNLTLGVSRFFRGVLLYSFVCIEPGVWLFYISFFVMGAHFRSLLVGDRLC